MGGARDGKKQKSIFFELLPSYFELNSSKSNHQIFKILTFLKTRDKTTSIKKTPPTPHGESWGSKTSPTIDHLGLLRRPHAGGLIMLEIGYTDVV